MLCDSGSIICFDNLGEVPVDQYPTLNPQFRLVVTISDRVMQFVRADDQYIPGADVSVKNTGIVSGFMSYNESGYVD